ncbi:hypothetical protein FF1_047293 [Malus domestica]
MALLFFNLPSSFFLVSFAFFCIAINLFSITNAPSGAEAARGDCLPVSSLITKQLFHTLFLHKHKDDTACPAKDFYTYRSFIKASKSFPGFGTTVSLTMRKREIVAFLAQIYHETTGGRPTAPDGPYAWGMCFKKEISPQSDYCDSEQVLQRKRPHSTILIS